MLSSKMKMVGRIASQLALTGISICVSSAFAGNSSGGGGEVVTSEESPWFIGSDPVRYCFEIDNGTFSMAANQAKKIFKDSVSTWVDVIQTLNPTPTPSEMFGIRKNITTRFLEEQNCSEKTDLQIFLGNSNSQVIASLRERSMYTVAFAKQTKFDYQTGRGKGIIWLVPDKAGAFSGGKEVIEDFWSKGSAFYNVISHELGHVFGFGHSDSGLMAPNTPIMAIAGGSQTTYTMQPVIAQHWPHSSAEFCGWLETDDIKYFEDTFSLPQLPSWEGCINFEVSGLILLKIRHHGVDYSSIQLDKSANWRGADVSGVIGRYVKQDSVNQFQWPKWHEFIPTKSFDHQVRSIGGSNNAPIGMKFLFQTLGKHFRFTYASPEGDFHFFTIEYMVRR